MLDIIKFKKFPSLINVPFVYTKNWVTWGVG